MLNDDLYITATSQQHFMANRNSSEDRSCSR